MPAGDKLLSHWVEPVVIMRMWIVLLVERLFMMQMVQLPILILYGNENTFVLDASSEFDFFGL